MSRYITRRVDSVRVVRLRHLVVHTVAVRPTVVCWSPHVIVDVSTKKKKTVRVFVTFYLFSITAE